MDLKRYAAAEAARAERTLATAAKLTDSDPDSAASRAYYAAFHMLAAYFARQNVTFTKHSAIRAALHRDLVTPGKVTTQIGEDFDTLASLREVGDYGGIVTIDQGTAERAVAAAGRVIDALRAVSG